jgi:hypothetical protein
MKGLTFPEALTEIIKEKCWTQRLKVHRRNSKFLKFLFKEPIATFAIIERFPFPGRSSGFQIAMSVI